jgi:hypothetical protein
MGIFATKVRKGAQAVATADIDLAEDVQRLLPARFEAIGERLAAGHDASAACAQVGRETARDGADLGEALDGLRSTYAHVLGGEPEFGAVRALCQAWSEETLGYLHQVSCEDPLTGLASLAHLRTRLSEIYRAADQAELPVPVSHALVVFELPVSAVRAGGNAFDSVLRLVRLAECARMAFPGGQTIAQASRGRLVLVTPRGDLLARRVGLLRDLVGDLDPGTGRARVWIEGLPPSDDGAGRLLDEITRS